MSVYKQKAARSFLGSGEPTVKCCRGVVARRLLEPALHHGLTVMTEHGVMMKLLVVVLVVLVMMLGGALGWLLTRPAVPKPVIDEYHAALERLPGSEAGIEVGLERFRSAFSNLADPALGERVATLYGDPLYFNDTLHTIVTRDKLVDYMTATSRSLDFSQVEVEQVMQSGADVWVRWTMHFQSAVGSRSLDSRSIGITHLRFDAAGRIVLHQDFWDAAGGLYRHLPVIGYVLDRADQQLPH
ncbi:MAG: nuclear transport factor 2 family protein [Wenzhouxiangellaceae bacterium]|nr:nuclear transport factor 2 family protein [Wenzhouxiangellaceae bacterium]